MSLSVKELTVTEIPYIVEYWLNSDSAYMQSMGVDLKKLPSVEQITDNLTLQIRLPYNEKRSLCLIWFFKEKPIGHCNTNPSFFGDYAHMHLHLWSNTHRQKGMGLELLKLTIPQFFEKLQLKKLICEPLAVNSAPNKILEKFGFRFIKQYDTVPGSINFYQSVKRWEFTKEQLQN